MEPRLIQQQSQRLILSPQIRQYLRLLQLPIAELQQAVEFELAENPVLEEKHADTEDARIEIPKLKEPDNKEVKPGESFDSLNQMDDNFRDSVQYPDFSRQDHGDLTEKRNFQETLITRPEILSDFLISQLRFVELTEPEKKIALEIIGNIDEDGYFRTSLEEVAQTCQQTPEAILAVLQKIQDFDPPGIAARNLQETLLIQLRKKMAETSDSQLPPLQLAIDVVQNHLPLLEKRDYSALAKSLSHDAETIKKTMEIISKLDPRPGRGFYRDDSLAVVPDAAIVPDEDAEGQFKVEIHDEKIPDIRVNPYYRKLLRTKNLDEKSKTFLKEKIQSALTFMQAVQLRKSTLREITEAIVKAQHDFLEKGFLHLKPLRLKDIANTLGIHESTVSRAIQGKYVSTPQGMIPYKSFFSTRMETSQGPAESQKSIMEKMRFLVGKESPKNPYSDQDIVKLMKDDGIVIARRTVAKYRDLLKILPSHMRRQK